MIYLKAAAGLRPDRRNGNYAFEKNSVLDPRSVGGGSGGCQFPGDEALSARSKNVKEGS